MLREAPCCPAHGATNPLLLTSLIALVFIRAGALIGMFVRIRKDTRRGYQDVARLRTGLIETIAGLVLSLLVASANTTFRASAHDKPSL